MNLESFSLAAAAVSLGLSALFSGVALASRRRRDLPGVAAAGVGLLFITVAITDRAIKTGHGPFSSMYEFAVAFSWGIVFMGLLFHWRYHFPAVRLLTIAVALGLIIFAGSLPSHPIPLVPALQQSYLLSAHVAAAVISYGSLTIGFGAAILYLLQARNPRDWLPAKEALDEISYRSTIIGFPFLTLVILLGALWADIAWGRYWGWDPKETASLVTWLLYAAYLHARLMRGWRGSRAAILLIIGFLAVLFTFFGNYIFTGLHSYG